MKLTPENIAAIEAVLTHIEEGNSRRGTMIEFGFSELSTLSSFLSHLRHLGVSIPKASWRGLSKNDRAEFIAWLRLKKAEQRQSSEAAE